MATDDKISNTADQLAGKVKDAAGDLTDDSSLQTEGKADQAAASAKQAGEKAKDTAADLAGSVASGGLVHKLSTLGLRSDYAYIGGFASIGFSLASWLLSRNKTGDDKAQSDRWGIFIGHWAPTFMALGVALKLEETKSSPRR